jgi:hypothetical protein
MKTISIRLDNKSIESIRDKAAEHGQTLSEAVRSIILHANEQQGLDARLSALEMKLDSLSREFHELDSLRRFREVFAQIKRCNISVEEFARLMAGEPKYLHWKNQVDRAMQQAAATRTPK